MLNNWDSAVAETSIGKPYNDKPIDIGRFLRKFDKDIDENELIWHRDKRSRVITVMSGEDWKLQFDDLLPVALEKNKQYKIPKETYHRILKGKGNLILEIREEE